MKAFLVGKGRSLDNAKPEWFGTNEPIWCLNQATDVIYKMLPDRDISCVQNDEWICYVPPINVMWYHRNFVQHYDHPNSICYNVQRLTGQWSNPSCMCALNLLKQAGFDEITMIGFDSHFDGSRTYATSLNVKSDEIAPFHKYDTMMRRWAFKNNVKLTWIDKDGNPFVDDFKFTKCLVAVAMGAKYTKQTDGMIASFLKHNPDWEVCRFYDEKLQNLLQPDCKTWSPFNKCELSRWIAMQKCLDKYDTVLYADGDIRWYGRYENDMEHGMVLYPHYVTNHARNDAKHWLYKDGVANIGIMEMSRSIDNNGIFDFIIGEVLHNPNAFKHKDQLWLQNIVSTLPDCGYDVVYNNDGGYNVAAWNLRHRDREVFIHDGEYLVGTNEDRLYPLVAFHFSSKSLDSLDKYGEAVKQLKKEYLNE